MQLFANPFGLRSGGICATIGLGTGKIRRSSFVAIYLDNAATSYPKPECVYRAMDEYWRGNGASAGRGNYRRALDAEELIFKTRKALASILDVERPGRIVLTANATQSLNVILKGYLKCGDTVLISDMEHNAVWRPLNRLRQERDIRILTFHCTAEGKVDFKEIETLLDSGVSLVAMLHGSNVSGAILPVAAIARLAHQRGIPVLTDVSQTAGVYPISVREFDVDFLAFTGHKGLLGPMGTGGFYIREGLWLDTLIEGGTGTVSKSPFPPESVPDRYEAGTMNMGGIAGLLAAAEYIRETGIDTIRAAEDRLIRRLMEGLSKYDGVEMHGPGTDRERLGLLSFNIRGVDPYKVAAYLDDENEIMVRAGLHCAPLAHSVLGTLDTGSIRASVGPFSRPEEIDELLGAVETYLKKE